MKKLLLFIGLIALTSFAFSQVKINENFDSELPATWTVINNNADASTWVFDDGGYGVNGSNNVSIDTYPGPADDYLVTPQFTVNDGDILSFYSASASSSYPDDFTVLVSKTGTNVTDFTITVGQQSAVPTANTKYEYDLTANANISNGDQIYIAIYCDTEGSYLNLDNFRVGPSVEIINEDFEDGIPGTWTVVDGGTNQNTWTDTLEAGMDGTNGVWVDCYESGFGQSDDWLITPQFKLRDGDVLSFWMYGNDAEYADTVIISVSKTGVTPADFTVHIDSIITEGTNWTKYQYELLTNANLAAGENVYLGIQAKSYGSRVFLDRVRVGEFIPPVLIDAYAVSENEVAFVYDAQITEDDITIGDFALSGSENLTFSSFVISDTDNKVAIATTSANMTSDNTLDMLTDNATSVEIEFYAGITSIEFLSLTNPDGIIEEGFNATFTGIVSATNDADRIWLADASGEHHGINTYDLVLGDATVNIGDEVLIYGEISPYRNQTELYPTTLIEVVSTGNDVFAATTITGASIETNIVADTDPAEKYEGTLVKIMNAEALDTITIEGDFFWIFSDDSDATEFYVGSVFGFITMDETIFTKNEKYDLTGIITGRDEIYALNPRDGGDISESVGINNPRFAENIIIYPNPVENTLYINNFENIEEISVINIIGQEMISISATNKTQANINVSELKSGIYFLSVKSGDNTKAIKFLKK